ncbi:type II toxin-antitoxin system VapC family toxin [Microbacterium sp.]|uniref:type II toxin-antitoxin system VapC family toxin n=1 Tax=Microbacterium sp. TaxID=51671 RepID=UPI0039E49365
MTGVVLDASVVIDVFVGDAPWQEWEVCHSHAGLDLEVLSVLRRNVLRGELPAHGAREILDSFRELDIERHPLSRLLPRAWAMRHDISGYDAGYVALAESLGVPLVTLDRRLAATASRYCDVIVP